MTTVPSLPQGPWALPLARYFVMIPVSLLGLLTETFGVGHS